MRRARLRGVRGGQGSVINYTKTAALELASYGIRVNAIAPDITLTEGLAQLGGQAALSRIGHGVPLGRAGHVDEIASAAVFLASDMSAYLTGQTLHIDGGTQRPGAGITTPQTGEYRLGPVG